MKISETVDYPAAPDTVFAMLTDEKFQARKCQQAGSLSEDVAVTRAGGGTRVVTRREMPTNDFPDFAKSLIGSRLTITETYEWEAADDTGNRPGELTVELGGAPVSLRAKLALTPDGAGTHMHLDGDLRASVPLIGGRIERSAAPAIIGGIHSEGAVGRAWLAGER